MWNVAALIRDGATTDVPHSTTPLKLAAQLGALDIVALLLDAGAHIDARSHATRAVRRRAWQRRAPSSS
jgi:ankyrin repeat protein